MKRKIIILFALSTCLLLVFGAGLSAASKGQNRLHSDQQMGTTDPPTETPVWLRIRNQIQDMLGRCAHGNQTLVEITGTLTTDGVYFYVGDVEVHFGPTWYVTSEIATNDYDGDGNLELISDELNGLVDSEVQFEGFYQSENWFSVFTINDMTYRDLGKPIWSHGKGSGNGNNP